jgi:hypothetical protein
LRLPALLAALLLGTALHAAPPPTPAPDPIPVATATPEPAQKPLTLAGRWGIGFDNIPGASAGTGLIPGLANPNAVAFRYWVNERLAWDGLLALSLSSQPPGGAGAAGVPAGTDQRGYGFGTVLKWNAKRPSPWLLAQILARASLASLSQLQNNGSGTGQTTTTFGLGVGAGFEAFLPAWDSLSVEGSVGLNFSSSQVKLEGGQAAQSGSSLGIDGSGFTPVNVSAHLYF